MAVTYSITITSARVQTEGDLTDIVKELDVQVKGQDGPAQFALPATLTLGAPDPDAFTAFASLTEAQLVEWVDAHPMIAPIKAHVAMIVSKEVEKLALTQKPLPWQPEPAPMPDAPPAGS